MNSEQNKIEDVIQNKLKEFEVTVPSFPNRKSRIDRLANWLFTPVATPLLDKDFRASTFQFLLFIPLLVGIVIFIPFLII